MRDAAQAQFEVELPAGPAGGFAARIRFAKTLAKKTTVTTV